MGREVVIRSDSEEAAPGEPWKPYRSGSVRDEQHIEFNKDNRVYQSIWRDGRLTTNFVLVQQLKVKGRWRDVLKIDCCHGAAHVHHLTMSGKNDTKDLQKIEKPADLLVGLEKATGLVFDHWQNNVRRWTRGK